MLRTATGFRDHKTRSTNPCVGGSNPSGRANEIKGLADIGQPFIFALCTPCARIPVEFVHEVVGDGTIRGRVAKKAY